MADMEAIDPKEALSVIHGRELSKEPVNIDPHEIVDMDGNPLKYGNDDPNIIGPDDVPAPLKAQGLRQRQMYPNHYPHDLFLAEEQWVLPFAAYVTENILQLEQLSDEATYRRIQLELRQRYIFGVIDLSTIKIHDQVVTWEGFKIWCKQWLLVGVNFKLDLRAKVTTIADIRLWRSAQNRYVRVGDPNGVRCVTREDAVTTISNYINQEGIFR